MLESSLKRPWISEDFFCRKLVLYTKPQSDQPFVWLLFTLYSTQTGFIQMFVTYYVVNHSQTNSWFVLAPKCLRLNRKALYWHCKQETWMTSCLSYIVQNKYPKFYLFPLHLVHFLSFKDMVLTISFLYRQCVLPFSF